MKLKGNKFMLKMEKMDKKKLALLGILFVVLILIIVSPKDLFSKKELDSVRLQQLRDNAIALMIPDDRNEGSYVEYEGAGFPPGYIVNIAKSHCIDINGQEVKNVLSRVGNEVTVNTSKTVYCTLYFEHSEATILIYDNKIKNMTNCTTVQCALDELYTVRY